ncbi:MAG TPA: GNAT family N-acetyltransferase [Yaniella sp.]
MTECLDYEIRPYRSHDAHRTREIFQTAVTVTAAHDYAPAQLAAWVERSQGHLSQWDQAMSARNSLVACIDDKVVGFTDIDASGYIHMIYVAPKYGRQGVASALLKHLEQLARNTGVPTLSAEVSITGRGLFEHHGFSVIAEHHRVLNRVELLNYHMTKMLR